MKVLIIMLVSTLATAMVGLSAWAAGDGAFLVKDGRAVAQAVLPDKARETERLAAEELTLYVQKMSGATLCVVAEKDAAASPSSSGG